LENPDLPDSLDFADSAMEIGVACPISMIEATFPRAISSNPVLRSEMTSVFSDFSSPVRRRVSHAKGV
jgi:hypothetical protein